MSEQITYGWRQPVGTNGQVVDPLMGKWYAVQVRPRSEQFVALLLESKGYQHCLPTWQSAKNVGCKVSQGPSPLFPGYLFCRWDIPFPAPIVATPGVVRIVGAGRTPIPVDEAELTAVMTIARAGNQARPFTGLPTGTRVQIHEGPLRGVQGVLQTRKNKGRLIVSVTLLNRSVIVDVDADSVTGAHHLCGVSACVSASISSTRL